MKIDNRRWSELNKEEKKERKKALMLNWFKNSHFNKRSKKESLSDLIRQQEKCLKFDNRSFC